MENQETGIIKWFNFEKGFGFIARPNGREVFYHISDVITPGYKMLHEGQRVTYFLEKKRSGLEAVSIQIL